MSKNMIIGIVIAIAVLGGGILVANSQSGKSATTETAMTKDDAMKQDGAAMEKNDTSMVKDDAAMEKDAAMMKKDDTVSTDKNASSYLEYTGEALAGVTDKRRVLYFYASWCPTCRPADADLKANASTFPSDVVVIRVNYNDPETDQEEKELAKQYGVTYQHTFVQIDGQGQQVTKWNGGQTTELLANIK